LSRKESSKYNKKISLYGMDEKDVLKELLKSPPIPSGEIKDKNKE